METTRRKLLTLLSSIPALGLLGAVSGTTAKAEAKTKAKVGGGFNTEQFYKRVHKNGSTDVMELPDPSAFSAWEKIERNIRATEFQSIIERNRSRGPETDLTSPLSIVDVLNLNKKIVKAHPSLFPTERIMTAPTCKINGEECVAESRYMKAEYTVEFAQDLKSICGLDAETELQSILADEMALELYHLDDMLTVGEQKVGYGICPYIPVQFIRAVDSVTFQPKIRLLTMYGVAKI